MRCAEGSSCRSALFHTGDNPGFRSLLLWLPESDVVFAGLSNEESAALDRVAVDVLRAMDH